MLKTSMVSPAMAALACVAAAEDTPSFSIGLKGGSGYATITNRLHPGNRIGYRFFEHTPLAGGEPPPQAESAGGTLAEDPAVSAFSKRPGAASIAIPVKAEGWAPQHWSFYLAPAPDGIDLLWVVDTGDSGLSGYYGVQQCFRMSGPGNEEWRRKIAETPAFSEFDRWDAEWQGTKTSLTYVLRGAALQPLPAVR